MKSITIKINTVNAAFEGDPEAEVARILKDAANKIARGNTDFNLLDLNGNKVGTVKATGK
jgi:hypothetical protein